VDATIGTALRSARTRAGWTRDVLAAASGVSTAAIEQIEAGRRRDIRVSTAVQLADALAISIDDLVRPDVEGTSAASHAAYLYSSVADLVSTIGAFVAAAHHAAAAVLVVTPARRLQAVRDAGHIDDKSVDTATAEDWCTTPTCAAEDYLEYVERKRAAGFRRIFIYGEPLAQRRPPHELNAWMRFESLTNIIFARYPVTILCGYHTGEVNKSVLRSVRETHPVVQGNSGSVRNHAYVPPQNYLIRT